MSSSRAAPDEPQPRVIMSFCLSFWVFPLFQSCKLLSPAGLETVHYIISRGILLLGFHSRLEQSHHYAYYLCALFSKA